jgi:FkbM family methyltransferase
MRFSKIKVLFQKLPFLYFIRFLIADIIRRAFIPQAKFFFAQGAEDILIMDILGKYNKGFYIDIGSNNPISNSNTFRLYLQGWNGILVDGNKQLIKESTKIRRKDICINALVSSKKQIMTFHLAENDLMSSVNFEHAKLASPAGMNLSVNMESITLNEIIEQHAANRPIDLLTIDVEGHDFEVLRSIDLKLYQPSLIVIEDLHHLSVPLNENSYVTYLSDYNYRLAGMDKFNLFFLKR